MRLCSSDNKYTETPRINVGFGSRKVLNISDLKRNLKLRKSTARFLITIWEIDRLNNPEIYLSVLDKPLPEIGQNQVLNDHC